jgi:hypothetical protein
MNKASKILFSWLCRIDIETENSKVLSIKLGKEMAIVKTLYKNKEFVTAKL